MNEKRVMLMCFDDDAIAEDTGMLKAFAECVKPAGYKIKDVSCAFGYLVFEECESKYVARFIYEPIQT